MNALSRFARYRKSNQLIPTQDQMLCTLTSGIKGAKIYEWHKVRIFHGIYAFDMSHYFAIRLGELGGRPGTFCLILYTMLQLLQCYYSKYSTLTNACIH
jgi:hypothetical protein